jgi:hypothetical protein
MKIKWFSIISFSVLIFASFIGLFFLVTPVKAVSQLAVGSRVSVNTRQVSVREFANSGSEIESTQRKGAQGVIVGGPKSANRETWWQVDFDNSDSGWVSGKYLSFISVAPAPVVTDKIAPSIPTNLLVTLTTVGQVNLAWTAATDNVKVTGYNVMRNNVYIASTPVASYSDTTVVPGVTYSYTITAYDAAGNISGVSSSVLITVPTIISPISPTPVSGTSSLLWGAYVGDGANNLSNFEALVGKKVNFYADFEGWDTNFPSGFSSQVGQQGKTLIIFWEPSFGYDSINNNSQDSYIKQFAADAKAYGYPVILVPFDEMNLNEEAWGYGQNNNTAAKFQTAWKHVHDLFSGATNVKFGLAYNSVSIPAVAGNNFNDYYPGGAYVDYVGVDGFNFTDPGQTFAQIFNPAMAQLATYNKPIIIFSTASIASNNKAAWITNGLGNQIKTYSNLIGWVWFNQGGSPNWLVNSDNNSLQAFKNILQ